MMIPTIFYLKQTPEGPKVLGYTDSMPPPWMYDEYSAWERSAIPCPFKSDVDRDNFIIYAWKTHYDKDGREPVDVTEVVTVEQQNYGSAFGEAEPNWLVSFKDAPGEESQDKDLLWKHLNKEHGLILVESELRAIIRICQRYPIDEPGEESQDEVIKDLIEKLDPCGDLVRPSIESVKQQFTIKRKAQ